MFLRPRHVTTAPGAGGSSRSDSALEDGLPATHDPEAEHKQDERRAPERRRRRLRMFSPRRLVACSCYTICVLFASSLVFVWSRRAAMAKVVSGPRPTSQFTVLVNTFRRPDQLELALRHYASCDGWALFNLPHDLITLDLEHTPLIFLDVVSLYNKYYTGWLFFPPVGNFLRCPTGGQNSHVYPTT